MDTGFHKEVLELDSPSFYIRSLPAAPPVRCTPVTLWFGCTLADEVQVVGRDLDPSPAPATPQSPKPVPLDERQDAIPAGAATRLDLSQPEIVQASRRLPQRHTEVVTKANIFRVGGNFLGLLTNLALLVLHAQSTQASPVPL